MKPWKAILAAVVIFLAGMASGAVTSHLVRGRPRQPPLLATTPPWAAQRAEFLRRASAKLDLTSDQRRQVDRLLQESQQRMRDLWAPVAPQAREELRQLRRRLAAELNAKQQKRFERLLMDRSGPSLGHGQPPGEPGWRRRESPPLSPSELDRRQRPLPERDQPSASPRPMREKNER